MEAVNLSGQPDLSMIDRVPWIELSHAYGAALDVPDQIRALVTADKSRRGALIWGFTSNLFHQGSVYSATVAAIPIFQQLLRYRAVTEKPLILELLANFAVGYPEDLDRVDLRDFVGHSDEEYSRADDEYGRDCYLGVAAGLPLYEALLHDEDHRTVASSCCLMAFFPAHAFGSFSKLLAVAADAARPDSVRSAALIACSYLNDGRDAKAYSTLLSELLKTHRAAPNSPVPLLAAAAAYCAFRERKASHDAFQQSAVQSVVDQALQFDIALPDDGVYPKPPDLDADDLAGYSQQIFNPDAAFPWGDLVRRMARASGKDSPALNARRHRQEQRRQRQRLDPSRYNVTPNVFDRDNVLAAVLRMHAWLDVHRDELPREVLDEFEPFQSHIDLVWDEVLKLLDSDDRFIRTAAENLVHRAPPSSEAAINSLIARLHDGETRLSKVLMERALSQQQCQDMCDRLLSGRFEPGFGHNQHTYREIVCQQGTAKQVWSLFDRGQPAEQSWACRALIERGLLDEHDPRVYDVQATDCLSSDPGRSFAARFSFARSDSHQAWFFSRYRNIASERRWAVVEAMEQFRGNLTAHEIALRSAIDSEESLLLKAKLIRLLSHFDPVTPQHLQYLLSLLNERATRLERSAVATNLAHWLGRGIDGRIVPELLALASDPSASVRRVCLNIIARGCGPEPSDDDDGDGDGDDTATVEIAGASDILRGALGDDNEDIRRLAVYHLFRRNEFGSDDLTRLLSPVETDRVCSDAILAAALSPDPTAFALDERPHLPEHPLTSSVLNWATNSRAESS